MGGIEKQSAKRKKKQDIQKALLAVVSTTAILATAVMAPNVLRAFEQLGIVGSRRRESISRARSKLLRDGLLSRDKNGYLILTKAGRTELARKQLAQYKIENPRKWDGRWRMIIFDIPEKRRRTRDQIRHTLNNIGFFRLQDSIWVYPYNCEDLIALLKSDMQIGKDLLYVIADSLEGDNILRNHFGLARK